MAARFPHNFAFRSADAACDQTETGCLRWDLVFPGEVMLRLNPGSGCIHTTRRFQAWEGGGEYNVARGLERCFGLDTAIVAAFANNAEGYLVRDLIYQGGVGCPLQ